jgi:hypothetical protein
VIAVRLTEPKVVAKAPAGLEPLIATR